MISIFRREDGTPYRIESNRSLCPDKLVLPVRSRLLLDSFATSFTILIVMISTLTVSPHYYTIYTRSSFISITILETERKTEIDANKKKGEKESLYLEEKSKFEFYRLLLIFSRNIFHPYPNIFIIASRMDGYIRWGVGASRRRRASSPLFIVEGERSALYEMDTIEWRGGDES